MNKLSILGNGGHPITQNDLQFIFDSLSDNSKYCMSFLKGMTGNDIVVLWGCEITEGGGNFTHTEGAVWIDGEVFYVPAKVVGTALDICYEFNVVQTNIAAGTKVYKNGATFNTRLQRVCEINSNSVGTATTFNDTNRWESPWRPLVKEANWTGSPQYRCRHGKIELDGSPAIASMAGGDREIVVLPSFLIPPTTKHFVIKGLDNGADAAMLIEVNNAGELKVIGGATGQPKTINLNDISYYLN